MRVIFDRIRDNIESKTGEDVFMTSYIFWELNRILGYENTDTPSNITEKYIAEVEEKMSAGLQKLESWNPRREVISWKAQFLREAAIEMFNRWNCLANKDLMVGSVFRDGMPCLLIEAIAEKMELDPTALFKDLKEIKFILILMKATANQILLDVIRFGKFKRVMMNQDGDEDFKERRILKEFHALPCFNYNVAVTKFKMTLEQGRDKLDKGERIIIERLVEVLNFMGQILEDVLVESYEQDHLLHLDNWKNRAYKSFALIDDKPGPFEISAEGLKRKIQIMIHLLIKQQIEGEDVFPKRNFILKDFVINAFKEETSLMLKEQRIDSMNTGKV